MTAAISAGVTASPACHYAADYAVVGLGTSGCSVLRFLAKQGATCIAMDTRAAPTALSDLRVEFPALRIVTGDLDADLLRTCRQIVVSPGISLNQPALLAAKRAGREIVGDIELFARHVDAPVIAITGTNGKSTVTTLVADILEASGFEARRGGNLGTPALDLLGATAPDFYVLELSSFQLDLTATLAPYVACILNIVPDHLDRHGSFGNYAAAKTRILEHAEFVIVNGDDAVLRSYACGGNRIEFSLGEPSAQRYGLLSTDSGRMLAGHGVEFLAEHDLKIAGSHNVANALAAIAICSTCDVSRAPMNAVLRSFSGLEHRAEYVATIEDSAYINDSKATNIGAACASISGLMADRGGVVIAGGDSKGAAFGHFAECAVQHAHTLVLIGRAAADIKRAVGERANCICAADMAGAVRAAYAAVQPGEVVLLAPACASFDMFANFEARGVAFRSAVAELQRS